MNPNSSDDATETETGTDDDYPLFPHVRIRKYPDADGYPDEPEIAEAIVQMTPELLNGDDWEGEHIPIALETNAGVYRLHLPPEFIDALRKSPYWDTVVNRLDEQSQS